jgi:hypothetical protein
MVMRSILGGKSSMLFFPFITNEKQLPGSELDGGISSGLWRENCGGCQVLLLPTERVHQRAFQRSSFHVAR